MKFRIESTCISHRKPEKLIKEYPCLRYFRFEVEQEEVPLGGQWIADENGRIIRQVSDETRTKYTSYIYIDTIEQLMGLLKAVKDETTEIIVGDDYIEIYDGYRE
jgi:hypothetical protein